MQYHATIVKQCSNTTHKPNQKETAMQTETIHTPDFTRLIAEIQNRTGINDVGMEALEVILQITLNEYYDAGYDAGFNAGYAAGQYETE